MPSQDLNDVTARVRTQLTLPRMRPPRPVLVILTGLPGTGKSTFARALRRRVPLVIIESDFVRKTMFDPPTYSAAESRDTHFVARRIVRALLREGYSVLYDATNLVDFHRMVLRRVAQGARAAVVTVRVVAARSVVRERLEHRHVSRRMSDISDASWEVYKKLARNAPAPRERHLTVSTQKDLDSPVERVVAAIEKSSRPQRGPRRPDSPPPPV